MKNRKYSNLPTYKIENPMMLDDKAEIEKATSKIQELRIEGHHDKAKNWDLFLSLYSIRKFNKRAKILDAGSGSKAVFAKSAHSLGFKNVFACDLQDISVKQIERTKCNLTQTPYKDNFFDAIACLSVIEHGVNLKLFSDEMYRICKPGGELIVSTDFWPIEEDYSDRFPYGHENPPMRLFSNSSMGILFNTLARSGWKVPDYQNFQPTPERPIFWERMNARYTFLWFYVKK